MHEAKWKKPQHICIMNTLNCQLVLLYVVFLLPREWAERELHFARRNILISLKQLFSLYHNNFEVELLSCYPPWNISRTLFSNRFPLVHVFCAWTTSYFSHMMLLPPRVNWGPWTSEMEPVNGECRQSIQWTDPDTRTSARAANTLLLDTQWHHRCSTCYSNPFQQLVSSTWEGNPLPLTYLKTLISTKPLLLDIRLVINGWLLFKWKL